MSLSERPSSAAQGRRLIESDRVLFQLNRAFLALELSEEAYVQQATALRGRVLHALTKLSTLKRLANSSVSFVCSLLRSEPQMWSFLQDPRLPIHNNVQERELRSAVIKRRLSFGSDTQEGGQGFAVLLSLMRTLKLRALLWLLPHSSRSLSATASLSALYAPSKINSCGFAPSRPSEALSALKAHYNSTRLVAKHRHLTPSEVRAQFTSPLHSPASQPVAC